MSEIKVGMNICGAILVFASFIFGVSQMIPANRRMQMPKTMCVIMFSIGYALIAISMEIGE